MLALCAKLGKRNCSEAIDGGASIKLQTVVTEDLRALALSKLLLSQIMRSLSEIAVLPTTIRGWPRWVSNKYKCVRAGICNSDCLAA